VGAPAVVATVFASIIGVVITWPENRMLVGIEIGVVSLVLLTLALFSSRDVRTRALGLNTAG
jgi:DMSO/TMAO reductase YedYZ heme-binding membrane subunit